MPMKKHCRPSGFTLIELLIAIAMVGILAAISVPSYQHYMRRAHYTEIIHATFPFKLAVEECYQMTSDLKECYGGKNNVPHNFTKGNGLIASVAVNSGGVITVTPNNLHGIMSTDTYILTPQINNQGQLNWQKSGGGIKAGYAS